MTLSKAFANMFWGLAAVLLLAGIILSIVTFVNISAGEEITGIVIRMDRVQNAIPFTEEDSGIMIYPVIEYTGAQNDQREYVSPRPIKQGEMAIGDAVSLLRSKNNQVRLYDFFGLWGRVLVVAGTALLFFIFGFGALKSFDSKKY